MNRRLLKLLFITALTVLSMIMTCLCAAAANIYTVSVTVRYGQTEARGMLSLVNDFRQSDDAWYWDYDDTTKIELDLKPLEYDYGLEEIAMQRAAEISVYYGHERPDGTDCFTALSSNGSRSWGENIAMGYNYYTTAESVFEAWQESNFMYFGQGHRRNMLDEDYTHIGIAHVVVDNTHYWVQEFGFSSSGTARTAANNSNKTVDIDFSSNTIKSVTLTPSVNTITLSPGSTANLPTVDVSLKLEESWIDPIKTTVTPNWTSSSNNISISNGKISGKSSGKATLSATIYGQSVIVNVTVECDEHDWENWIITKTETCTENGTRTHECSVCGATETESVPATGHSFGDYTVTKAATCTEEGVQTRICSVCSQTESYPIPVKGHSFGAYITTKAATCTEQGSETRTCSVCSQTESRTVAAKGHSFGEYKTVTAATTTSEGLEERTCSVCNTKDQRTIAKLSETEPSNSDSSGDSEVSENSEDSESGDNESSDNESMTDNSGSSGGSENNSLPEHSSNPQPEVADNTLIYILIGVGLLAVGGALFAIYFKRNGRRR